MKMLKIFAIIGIIGIMFGCSGIQPATSPAETHKLEIMVNQTGQVKAVTDEADQILSVDQRNGMGLGTLSNLAWMDDAKTTLHVKIYSGLTVADVERFYSDLKYIEANEPGIKDVSVWINSPGGNAFSGLALSDTILHFRAKGYNIEAHANGIIASAAVPVYASCSKRYASKGTIFMVHEAALWKWPGRESASDIRSQNELMITLQDLYISYLVAPTTKLSKAEWIEKERATTWFNVDKALEWGLVDHLE